MLQYVKVSNSNYFLYDDIYLHFRSETVLKLQGVCEMLGQSTQVSSLHQKKKVNLNICPEISDF